MNIEWMNEMMNEWMNKLMNEWINEQIDERTNRWMNEWMTHLHLKHSAMFMDASCILSDRISTN